MRIGIVGLGLIGGSLGLDLRHQGHEVLGVSAREQTCQRAIARGAVDVATLDYGLLGEAEVVFLCTPLNIMASTTQKLVPFLQSDAVLTDVGSVKTPVVRSLSPLWPQFVGGHPMAGTAAQGIEAAQRNLFCHRPYVLTPTSETPPEAVARIKAVISALGVTLQHCTPEVHDRAVAWISHLPVMVSTSLIAACLRETDQQVLGLAKVLASSGFQDTSRVGGGNPELGLMMAKYNRQALLQTLYGYQEHLHSLIQAINQENWQNLERELQNNQQARSQFVQSVDPNCPEN